MHVSWALEEIARATGGCIVSGEPGVSASGVSIDTRTLAPGEAFLAIRGERFDGHDFLAEARARGAACAVIEGDRLERAREATGGMPLVVVGDTVAGLGALAASVRDGSTIPWIAVTGSAGKTTTKELAAAALGAFGPALRARASFNNRIGVPLTILGLCAEHRTAVVELGTSAPGEIAPLARLVRPTVAVVTNIGCAHLEGFGTLQAVAHEKAELVRALPENGTAILPAACEHSAILRDAARGHIVTFGFEEHADVRAEYVRVLDDGTSRFGAGGVEFRLNLVGRAGVLDALAALAAAEAVGVRRQDAARLMAEVAPLPLRCRVIRAGGLTVLADCYNANPLSFDAALDAWQAVSAGARAWVVAGDMRELGAEAGALHEALGAKIARAGAAALLAVGEFAGNILHGAAQVGMPARSIIEARHAQDAAGIVAALARAGDVILVKGSRAVGLELVVEALVACQGAGR